MALIFRELTQQFAWIIWIFTLLLREATSEKSKTVYMGGSDCDNSYMVEGATVLSHRASDSAKYYSNNIDCRITFRSENLDWKLMLRIEDLDIPDTSYNSLCNDALYLYDAKTVFGLTFRQAGGTGGLCGQAPPSVIYSSGPYLTVYFRTDKGGISGRGFRIIITAFSEDYDEFRSCGDNFHCSNHLCIAKGLTCDKIDHCGDWSDEQTTEPAKCGADDSFMGKILSLGITAAIAITVGTLVVIVVVIVCVVCCCCRCSKKRREAAADTSSTHAPATATSVTINNGGPVMGPPQYNQSNYPQQQGYYPLQQVHPHPGAPPGVLPVTYSPYPQRDSYSAQGSVYSSHPPPSYHRSYTPTSSKSGRSHQSSGDNIVKYNHDKVALPVHV